MAYAPSYTWNIPTYRCYEILVGGWALPLWKIWVHQLGLLYDCYSQYLEEIKNVPNHQPVMFPWFPIIVCYMKFQFLLVISDHYPLNLFHLGSDDHVGNFRWKNMGARNHHHSPLHGSGMGGVCWDRPISLRRRAPLRIKHVGLHLVCLCDTNGSTGDEFTQNITELPCIWYGLMKYDQVVRCWSILKTTRHLQLPALEKMMHLLDPTPCWNYPLLLQFGVFVCISWLNVHLSYLFKKVCKITQNLNQKYNQKISKATQLPPQCGLFFHSGCHK